MNESSGPRSPSRNETVLDPSFLEGLEDLSLDEVRRRRDEALAEREFQSYLRRLLQVREDLLVAERERRQTGAPSGDLVERLAAVLATGPQGRGRGEAIRVNLPPKDLEEAERRADRAMGSLDALRPEALDDARLEEILEGLAREERAVSADRSAVLRVHDRLQDELKRRYREDPSLIPRSL